MHIINFDYFIAACSLNCSEGYSSDDNCESCIPDNICLTDNPCQNNGTCKLENPLNTYTCNCTMTNYSGDNCSGIVIKKPPFS